MARQILETTISVIAGGNYTAMVMHWDFDDTGSSFTLYQMANDFNLAYAGGLASLLADCLGDDSFVSSVRSRVVFPTPGPTAVKLFAPGDNPGAFGSNMDAFQTACVLGWLTEGNETPNGRSFVPAVPQDALEGNRFTVSYKDMIGIYATAVIAGITNGTLEYYPVLRHGSPSSWTYGDIKYYRIGMTPGHIKKRRVPV